MRFFDLTDIGKLRSLNQDYVYAVDHPIGKLENLFLVADGMGGHNAGEYASKTAVDLVVNEVISNENEKPVAVLEQAIVSANHALYGEAACNPAKAGMGTTFVAATISDNHLYVANVGDSRLYTVDKEGLHQITRDHSLVEEMVRRGGMNESEAAHHRDKHVITRAVGAEDKVRVDFFDVHLTGEEQILMCTDGLTNMVENEQIGEILTEQTNPKEKAEKLVNTANQNGGKDNITVIVIEPFSDEVKAC